MPSSCWQRLNIHAVGAQQLDTHVAGAQQLSGALPDAGLQLKA